MITVCGEHIDRAIDDHIDATGEPPEVLTLAQAGLPPRECAYCPAAAGYIITRPRAAGEGGDDGAL